METKLKRLNQIQSELDKLFEEKYSIEKQIAEESSAKHLARVNSWKLDNNSCILLFAKERIGYHWLIAKTIKVKKIDYDKKCIDVIVANYGEADYEYYLKVEEQRIPFSSLEDIEREFNIYFVDEVQLTLLQQHFCNLKIDYKNYREYEEAFAKSADMSIKIPV